MMDRLPIIIFPFIFFILISCSRTPNNISQGYIEGDFTYIASNVSGRLKILKVDRGMQVRAGELLFVLESQPESDAYRAAEQVYNQAVAAKNAIEADVIYSKLTFERNRILVTRHAVPQSELDIARSRYASDQAKLAQAEASISEARADLEKAKWMLVQKSVVSPVDGFVYDTFYRLGENTESFKPILAVLAPSDVKAIFFLNENNLSALHLNDKVIVNCDGCKQSYLGYVTFISNVAEYTPPVIYSNQTNEKLVFRIEARFNEADARRLHPGQPIAVTIPYVR